ncbi:IS4 family transposase [Anaerorudis cellulosivorans]|uniref:IS4 family transposase n=1 Tax=Anaerorudis cellulosivorans TaxID=3397862 RepID=UPI00222060A1|nr:IS4 family transposase [Seramator thermalis]MCW1734764.1 IS4 family transposase [Seramator thermalis]
MGKGTNFSGQPIFTQLLNLLDKSKISKASKALGADKYVKRFTSHKHIVVMLFVAFEGYNSIRETVLGLLSNAHRLGHLGLDYVVRRSTLSEANARRTPDIFAQVYYDTYQRYSGSLADSSLSKQDMKRLYIMDSTTITLFKNILKGLGRNPDNGKKKGGIKAHTIIRSEDNRPCFIRYTEAAKHDHLLLKEVNLPEDSILCFDKGYVDYAQYEVFTRKRIWYVTRLKDNALYQARKEFDIPDDADSGVLKDELIELSYGKNKTEKHLSRRIAYWDSTNGRLFEFITNNNENAIIIQIWSVMPANLLLMILKSRIKRKWAFSNMVSVIRQHLMSYIDVRSFFENPEKAWQELLEEQKARQNGITGQYSLFPQWEGACF